MTQATRDIVDTAAQSAPSGTRLTRVTYRRPDGRHLHLYGEGGVPEFTDEPIGRPPTNHLRWDALTATWVCVSPARNARPHSDDGDDADTCPFCPGGLEVPCGYDAAVFDNRFPPLSPAPPSVTGGHTAAAAGRCEMVLYTSTHSGSLGTLPVADVCRVIAVWRDRSRELWSDPLHQFVLIFENRGEPVGATLSHPHGQIYAFPYVPPLIAGRVDALLDGRRRTGLCTNCALVASDVDSAARTVVSNASFSVAVPYAARWPYEVHVRARRHGLRRLADLTPDERLDLARAVREVVQRYDAMFGGEFPYMMTIMEAPEGAEDWHLSVEFLPPHRGAGKLKIRASVETAAGTFINDTLPEESAARLAAVSVAPTSWDGASVPDVLDTTRKATT